MVTEQTNLLLDYIEKFINQSSVSSEQPAKLESDISAECQSVTVEVEKCIPYAEYVCKKKHYQLTGLIKALDMLTRYFEAANEKCEHVANKAQCQRVVVSLTTRR